SVNVLLSTNFLKVFSFTSIFRSRLKIRRVRAGLGVLAARVPGLPGPCGKMPNAGTQAGTARRTGLLGAPDGTAPPGGRRTRRPPTGPAPRPSGLREFAAGPVAGLGVRRRGGVMRSAAPLRVLLLLASAVVLSACRPHADPV